jgi:histidinol-phosphate aminotransferase
MTTPLPARWPPPKPAGATPTPAPQLHGGPDAGGPLRWDFSTNANAAGPCPAAWQALQHADPSRYPDPGSHALREQLAAWHGVAPGRILLAASASEFIQRITAVGGRLLPGPVQRPLWAYGDYDAAARACGRVVLRVGARQGGGAGPDNGTALPDACATAGLDMQAPGGFGTGTGTEHPADLGHSHAAATLRWYADPDSPAGQDAAPPRHPGDWPTVLDLAYAPLRLVGQPAWPAEARDAVFQLCSPNKALGLTGVRGAYAIAPQDAAWPVDRWCQALVAAQPSWPLGAHAVAMLQAWTEPASQAWLAHSLTLLRQWTADLRSLLQGLGLAPGASVTPFLLARRPAAASAQALRGRGLAVRDTASFGLPGAMRLSAQPPEALAALGQALHTLLRAGAGSDRPA